MEQQQQQRYFQGGVTDKRVIGKEKQGRWDYAVVVEIADQSLMGEVV